jgi:hypothetical protein
MKHILTIFFLFLFSHFYSQSVTVDLKNENILFDTIQFVNSIDKKADSIFIDSKYVGILYYDSDYSGILASNVMIYLNVICPVELTNEYDKINQVLHYGVENEYLKRLKTDTVFSKNKNTSPVFKHLKIQNGTEIDAYWAAGGLVRFDLQANLVELSHDDYIRLSSVNMKKSANLKIISKTLIIGGSLITILSPPLMILGAIAGISSIIVDFTADSKLFKSAYFLSKSTDSK